MFWSKIWLFLVAVAAAIALTLTLLMPKPAERATRDNERSQLRQACTSANILLRDSARDRVQLAGDMARSSGLDEVLFNASKGEIVSGEAHTTGNTALAGMKIEGVDVALLDRHGRVVARSGKHAQDFGDSLAGYAVVDDALDGYVRDDVWAEDGALVLVAGVPVITRQSSDWAGALVVRDPVDKDLTTNLAKELGVGISFYTGGEVVATSNPLQIHKDVLAHYGDLKGADPARDCFDGQPFTVDAGDKSYWVQMSRLPGEAGQLGSFFAVFSEQASAVGFSGTLKSIKRDDLGFGHFPWIAVGVLFFVVVVIGMGLLIIETDRPLRRLSADAVLLAKGEAERLDEIRHRSKFGSIARSVNIAIDKLHRETRSAKKDLDQLLGPLPDAAGPSPLPAMGPTGDLPTAFSPPPPSDFKFSGGVAPRPAPPPMAPAPAPVPTFAPPANVVAAGGIADFELDFAAVPPPPAMTPNPAQTPPPVAPPRGSLAMPAPSPFKPEAGTPPPPITLPPVKKPPIPTNLGVATPRPTAAAGATPPTPGQRRPTPLPVPASQTPPPGARAAPFDDDATGARRSQVISVDEGEEDEETRVSAGLGGTVESEEDAAYFREIFNDFLTLKKKCGESIESLTYAKFSRKLMANRDALIAKHGCKTVKFQVYVKDGKAALKASPVR